MSRCGSKYTGDNRKPETCADEGFLEILLAYILCWSKQATLGASSSYILISESLDTGLGLSPSILFLLIAFVLLCAKSIQTFKPLMSTFYACSKNHSIVGQMDTYLDFHRERDHPRLKTPDHEKTFNRHRTPDDEKTFNPNFNSTFPLAQHLSEESNRHPNYLNTSPTSPYQPGRNETSTEALNKIRTANSLTISPELFEKIYLNPQNDVKGDLRQTFGNPTPLALLGFLLSLSPLSCELMGWRGAGGDGIATVGAYYFIGGFLMSLGGILEFFLGNTFSFVVFCSFGGFWFTLGATLTPAFNAYGEYATDPNNIATGLTSPQFHASFGKNSHALMLFWLTSTDD